MYRICSNFKSYGYPSVGSMWGASHGTLYNAENHLAWGDRDCMVETTCYMSHIPNQCTSTALACMPRTKRSEPHDCARMSNKHNFLGERPHRPPMISPLGRSPGPRKGDTMWSFIYRPWRREQCLRNSTPCNALHNNKGQECRMLSAGLSVASD